MPDAASSRHYESAVDRWLEVVESAASDPIRSALAQLPELVQSEFDLDAARVHWLDGPSVLVDPPEQQRPPAGERTTGSLIDDVLTLPLSPGGEPLAELHARRRRGFTPALRENMERFAGTASQILDLAQERHSAAVMRELWERLSRPDEDDGPLQAALEVLRTAIGADVVGVVEYRHGRLATRGCVGQGRPELMAFLGAPRTFQSSLVAEAYASGEESFFVDRAPDAAMLPDAVRQAIRAFAVRPMPRQTFAHRFMVAICDHPHRWTASDRSLVRSGSRALRMYLERRRQTDLIRAVLALERSLLSERTENAMQVLISSLVELVPGAEAGSILVREGNEFEFAGISGHDAALLHDVRISEAQMYRWHRGPNHAPLDASRMMKDESGLEQWSDHASEGAMEGRGNVGRILANLSLPVEHGGQVAALVNLDAFASAHAFLDEDSDLLEGFAPLVGFVLYESGVRRELERLATHDTLTGIENRRSFDTVVAQELARVDRSDVPLALMVLDLDDFKELNDTLGHVVGDMALKRVAAALRSTARASDRVFRWGGDEFAALLPDSDEEGAENVVQRLREAVDHAEGEIPALSLSVGVAIRRPGDGTGTDTLLSAADAAMYASKRGKGR